MLHKVEVNYFCSTVKNIIHVQTISIDHCVNSKGKKID